MSSLERALVYAILSVSVFYVMYEFVLSHTVLTYFDLFVASFVTAWNVRTVSAR